MLVVASWRCSGVGRGRARARVSSGNEQGRPEVEDGPGRESPTGDCRAAAAPCGDGRWRRHGEGSFTLREGDESVIWIWGVGGLLSGLRFGWRFFF